MIDLEREEARVLAAARRALSPSLTDAERVLSGVERTLTFAASGAPAGTPAQAASIGSRPWLRAPVPRWFALGLAVGSAALGYVAGLRSASRSSVPAPVQGRREVTPSPAHAMNRQDPSTAPGPAPDDARAPSAPIKARLPPIAGPLGSTADTKEAKNGSLEEEVRTLRRVERALRTENPRLAIALLGDLDRVVPGGQLAEERLAASVQARCLLGYGSAVALLEDFVKLHPTSAYLKRVRAACDAETNAVALPETAPSAREP